MVPYQGAVSLTRLGHPAKPVSAGHLVYRGYLRDAIDSSGWFAPARERFPCEQRVEHLTRIRVDDVSQ